MMKKLDRLLVEMAARRQGILYPSPCPPVNDSNTRFKII